MEVFSFDQLTLLSDSVLLFVGVQSDSNGCALKSTANEACLLLSSSVCTNTNLHLLVLVEILEVMG